jgi:hypothetical protein
LDGKKSLNASQPENYDGGYALDYYRHLGRIVASRLLGFPCRRGLNPPSFGDRCDCADNKACDRSTSVGLVQGSKGTGSRCIDQIEPKTAVKPLRKEHQGAVQGEEGLDMQIDKRIESINKKKIAFSGFGAPA